MRHAYRCHVSSDAVYDFRATEKGGRTRAETEEIIGVARCPRCRTPLVARMGRRGPYLDCRCEEAEKGR